jgi:hypothetical protein
MVIEEPRNDDGCVGNVLLLDPRASDHLDNERTVVLRLCTAAEKGAEYGIAVEAREAGPGDFASRAYDRANRSISSKCEIERRYHRLDPLIMGVPYRKMIATRNPRP